MSLLDDLLSKILATPDGNSESESGEGGAGSPAVDVAARLDTCAAEREGEFEWRISIVDLLKLLDLDSSYEARQKLAVELGLPKDEIHSRGSAELNLWVLRRVFESVCEKGGNLPADRPV